MPWPPKPLGLGTALNVALLSSETRANLVYGWLYWRRGLELAVLTHALVPAILYIGVPALR